MLNTKYQMLVVQSKEQIMLLKYQTFRKKFTASDYNELIKEIFNSRKRKEIS